MFWKRSRSCIDDLLDIIEKDAKDNPSSWTYAHFNEGAEFTKGKIRLIQWGINADNRTYYLSIRYDEPLGDSYGSAGFGTLTKKQKAKCKEIYLGLLAAKAALSILE